MSNGISDKFTLMFVDDDPTIASALKRTFYDKAYKLILAGSGPEALEIMADTPVDMALVDLNMPEMDGITLLREINTQFPAVSTLMLTGHGKIQDAVAALKNGAIDFIEKPFVPEQLIARIDQVFRLWQVQKENNILKTERLQRFRYDKLLGNAESMVQLKKLITRVGISDTTVLIQGETGTGKELVAHAIHYQSPRANNPFVVVDCTTINETMLESELFGHVKGAFTGAVNSSKGLIISARNGTVFLDEIGELPLQTQSKLLRLIQEKEIRPVGSNKSQIVDVRILAATNRCLEAEVEQKRFRQDLFFRLNAVALTVPPLRRRTDDIHLLAQHFIKKHQTEFSLVRSISQKAFSLMEAYSWPGNVRELENLISRFMALGVSEEVEPEDLPEFFFEGSQNFHLPGEDTLEAYERLAIENALKKCGHHRKKAANCLGIGEATLYRKIKKYWPDA